MRSKQPHVAYLVLRGGRLLFCCFFRRCHRHLFSCRCRQSVVSSQLQPSSCSGVRVRTPTQPMMPFFGWDSLAHLCIRAGAKQQAEVLRAVPAVAARCRLHCASGCTENLLIRANRFCKCYTLLLNIRKQVETCHQTRLCFNKVPVSWMWWCRVSNGAPSVIIIIIQSSPAQLFNTEPSSVHSQK